MASLTGDGDQRLNRIEETLREALVPERDPTTAPFKGKCETISNAWQAALAEKGIFVPVMNAADRPERPEGHRFLVVGNTIIDPTIGQFATGDVAEGEPNQYEPFIGPYPEMVDWVRRQMEAGQMTGYATPEEALAKGWGLHPDPGGNGFVFDDTVVPSTAAGMIVPTSVDEVRRMMEEQRTQGVTPGQGLAPDFLAAQIRTIGLDSANGCALATPTE